MTTSRFLRRPALIAGVLIVGLFAAVAVAAPLLAPPQSDIPQLIPRGGFGALPQPPGPGHPLGTTENQNDIYYGLVWGTRAAFRVGVLVTLGRAAIGVLLGLVAGYRGGWADAVLMRATDAFMAFPAIAGVMVMLALFGNVVETLALGGQLYMVRRIETVMMVALIVFGWMSYARVTRGNVLAEREKEYVQAARATGVGGWRILFRHMLPNVTQGLFVLAAADVGAMVVLVAAFNFIGFGAASQGEMPAEWGQILNVARNWIIGSPGNAFEYWYTYVPVSAAILLFAVGWNLVGDGLRDALDPRLR